MLHVFNPGTPLPDHPAYIPLQQIYLKQSLGFILWNGARGLAARLFLIPMSRQGHPQGVLRFLGGSAVPFPYGKVTPGLCALIRLQQYFGLPLSQETADDYVPLHIMMSDKIKVYATNALQTEPAAEAWEVADCEVHGLLPASPEFLAKYEPQIDEVLLLNDRIVSSSGRHFNDAAIPPILRHLFAQVRSNGLMQCLTEINPPYVLGDLYAVTAG